MKLVTNNIAEHRYKAAYTQRELAKMLDVSRTTVFNWENAIYQPSPRAQNAIIEFFQVDRDELFTYA